MSSITKCLNTSTICRKVARCDKKLCVVLIEADIFNKAVQGNIPKPLRNLYIKFDVNTLRYCGEMARVEEYLHTFGNSDITTLVLTEWSYIMPQVRRTQQQLFNSLLSVLVVVPSHRLRITALLSSGCKATVEGLPDVHGYSTTHNSDRAIDSGVPRFTDSLCTWCSGSVFMQSL